MDELDQLLSQHGMDDFDEFLSQPIVLQGERGEKGDKGDTGDPAPKIVDMAVTPDYEMLVALEDGSVFNLGTMPKGEKGDSIKGDKGESIRGEKGDPGRDGKSIKGEKGDKGDDGLSAYQIWAVENEGSEQDFLDSLKGKDGNAAQWFGNSYTEIKEMQDVAIVNPTNNQVLAYNSSTLKWQNQAGGGGGSSAFNDITSGTNTTAEMVVGTGASLEASGSGTIVATSATGNAGTATKLATGRTIAVTGDITYTSPSFDGSANVTAAGTLATVNSNVGTFGTATKASIVTVNAKGLVTAASESTVTPAVGSITGLGTGVATALGINIGSAGSPVVNGGALGTPSSGVATNLTGTASGLTAGTVTTNANLTGAITSSGNATSLGSFSSANLAAALTDETGSGAAVFATSPTLVTPTLGVATATSLTTPAGSGSATMATTGVINVQYTAVGNVGAGEDDLMTYTLPANSLSAAGKFVRVFAWGTGANNANAKTVNTYIGGTQVNTAPLLTNAAGVWRVEFFLICSGTDTQSYFSEFIRLSATAVDVAVRTQGTLALDDGAGIILKLTGTATSNNDITQNGMTIQFMN